MVVVAVVVVGPAARRGDESVEFGVEEVDEGAVRGDSAEHLEAGAVVSELGAGLGFVKSPGWQQRQLPDFGDLVRGEDRERVGLGVGYAVAQLAFALLVIVDRWIV